MEGVEVVHELVGHATSPSIRYYVEFTLGLESSVQVPNTWDCCPTEVARDSSCARIFFTFPVHLLHQLLSLPNLRSRASCT